MYKCCFLACFCANQRLQRRKAELTVAQIRKKLPNGWADWHKIWHTCANSYGNGYTPNRLPLETQEGQFGGGVGVLGGQQLKSLGKLSDWHQLWFTSADIRQTNCLSRHKGHVGGFRRQTFKSLGKLSNGCTDWHQLRFMSADSSGSRYRLNTSRPTIPRWHFWGVLGGHKFKCLGKLSNGLTDWHQLLVLLGMDIAKYNSPLNSTRGISRILGGHKLTRYPTAAFKNLGNVVKWLDRLGINFAHIMQVNLEMDTG